MASREERTESRTAISVLYLDAETVEHHLVDGGHVEVERRESQALHAAHQLQQLSGSPPREDFHVGVALDDDDLDVGRGSAALGVRAG